VNAACRAALGALERLGHHDVLDTPDTHSRTGRGDPKATVWHFKNGLAARRLWNFRAVHYEALSGALGSLEGRPGAEAGALRGRLRRLLGDREGARRELEASWAEAPSARAAAWLGEMSLFEEPERALGELERAFALDRSWPWPHLWKAVALLALKRTGSARRELEAFAGLARPRPFVFHLIRFQLHMMERDYRRAHGAALEAIRLDPASPAGYDTAGKALHELKRAAGALARFHDARERDLDVAGAYVFEVIDLNLTWETPEPYLADLNAAIAKRPRMAALYAERAELKRDPRLCRYEEALEDYARAVRLEPRRAWLRAVLARARNNLHGGEAGLEDFDRAVRLAPDCGWIRAWRGALLARLGRQKPALADFEAAARLMPWYPFTYSWRGALLNRMGRFSKARRDLDVAIRLDPGYTFSFYERFRALRGLKDYPSAVRDLNRSFTADPKYTWFGPALKGRERAAGLNELAGAVKRHPKEAWLRAWKGHCHLELGSPAAALRDLDQALALEKKSGLIFAWRGRACRDLGRLDEAMTDLARAVRLEPGLWAAHQVLAEVREARGELEAALVSMTAVTRLAPTTVPYLLSKARLALRLERRKEALADLDRALQLDASYAEARLLKARLRLESGDAAAAAREAEAVLSRPGAPGLAYLIRGLARQKTGDLPGQISDFRRVLVLSPELFSESERRAVAELVRSDNA
jgi:tetratricopeptide (TPR) repeat protein